MNIPTRSDFAKVDAWCDARREARFGSKYQARRPWSVKKDYRKVIFAVLWAVVALVAFAVEGGAI